MVSFPLSGELVSPTEIFICLLVYLFLEQVCFHYDFLKHMQTLHFHAMVIFFFFSVLVFVFISQLYFLLYLFLVCSQGSYLFSHYNITLSFSSVFLDYFSNISPSIVIWFSMPFKLLPNAIIVIFNPYIFFLIWNFWLTSKYYTLHVHLIYTLASFMQHRLKICWEHKSNTSSFKREI